MKIYQQAVKIAQWYVKISFIALVGTNVLVIARRVL